MLTLKPLSKKKDKSSKKNTTNSTVKTTTKRSKKIDKLSKALHMALDLNEKKPVVAGNGEDTSKKIVKTGSSEEKDLFTVLHPEIFNLILKHLTNQCAKALHMTCKTTNTWIRERLAPIFQHIDRIPALRKEGILNPQVLRHMSLTDFINTVRPVLTNYPHISQAYIEAFTREQEQDLPPQQRDEMETRLGYERVNEVIDETNNLYYLKRIALQFPELNEPEVMELATLHIGQGHVDNRPLAEFLQTVRPLLIQHPRILRIYLDGLREILEGDTYGPFPNQEHDARDGAPMRTIIQQRIYSLEHLDETSEELQERFPLVEEDQW
jgi:hypothetical protein